MEFRELAIAGAFEITPRQFADDRGVFFESYRFDRLAEVVGHAFDLRQANTSVSAKGVVRGIHFADIPRGQAKYVSVTRGAVKDFVVDIRVGSPTFGEWDAVVLDEIDRRSVYVPEGFGHAFVALTDDATVTYFVSDVFQPTREHGVSPLDEQIALDFGLPTSELRFSEKDAEAPSLAQAQESALLPTYSDCLAWYATLNEEK